MRPPESDHSSYARFVVESGKRSGRGRTHLFLPPASRDALSVYTASDAPASDLHAAGQHVAEARERCLYGWFLTRDSAYREHGLRIEPDPTAPSFGACHHMNVCGWPIPRGDRMAIAQALGEVSQWQAAEPSQMH